MLAASTLVTDLRPVPVSPAAGAGAGAAGGGKCGKFMQIQSQFVFVPEHLIVIGFILSLLGI